MTGSTPGQSSSSLSLHSRPVRIGLAVAIALLSIHLLLPSSTFRAASGSAQAHGAARPSLFEDYASEGLPVDMSPPKRPPKPKFPITSYGGGGDGGGHAPASSTTKLTDGKNALVLFTSDTSSLINLLSIEAEIVAQGAAAVLPGFESSHVRSFIPAAWLDYMPPQDKAHPRESFERMREFFGALQASFSPKSPGVGGFLLGSCEVE